MARKAVRIFLLAALVAVLSPPVSSAVAPRTVSFDSGILTVTGTAGSDSLGISCMGGDVGVDGVVEGNVPCRRVKTLVVNGKAGEDTVDLTTVRKKRFVNLVSVVAKGGGGRDYLDGSAWADALFGGGGDDVLSGYRGVDDLSGGPGTDEVEFEGVNPMAVSGSLLKADNAKDRVSTIEVLDIAGSDGDDTVDASAWPGTTEMSGRSGNDTMIGSPQADSIEGGSDDDVVKAGRGDDTLRFYSGTDTFNGGRGVDTVFASASTSITLTDDLLTVVAGFGGTATLASIEHAELYGNTAGAFTIDASGWSRTTAIRGAAGVDTITGGSGRDLIDGYSGDDSIDGNGGSDTLNFPSLSASGGSLTLDGSTATSAQWGTDTYTDMEKASFVITASYTVDASAFPGPITAQGSGFIDTILGGSGDDEMYGNAGNDTLIGNGGADLADGGDGTDTCVAETEVSCEM